jgi:hypothetical protein
MAKIEPLNIRITGSSEGLSTALAGAQQKTQGFASSISSSAVAGAAMGVAFAAANKAIDLVADAIGNVLGQFGKIDEIAKQAERLGVSFRELQGIRLSIGEATGLDTGAIDGAIQKFQVNLAEAAATGAGKAADALRSLGLSAEELLALGPQKAFERIAQQLSAIESPAERMRVAVALFGRAGADMVNALQNGPEALQRSAEWAQRNLGITDAQADQVERMNDMWGRVVALAESLWQNLAAEVAPVAADILEAFVNWIDALGGVKQLAYGIGDAMRVAAGFAVDMYELLTSGDLNFDTAAKWIQQTEQLRNQADSSGGGSTDLALAQLEQEERAAEAAAKAAESAQRRAESLRSSLATPLEKYQQTIADLEEAFVNGGLEWEYVARGMEQAREQLERAEGRTAAPQLLGAASDRAEQLRQIAQFELGDKAKEEQQERKEQHQAQMLIMQEQLLALQAIANQPNIQPQPVNL